ncbi:hypothetical protein GCM10025774_00530 [Microbacterium kyungheense]
MLASDPSAVEVASALAVAIAVRTKPISAAAPFSPVTVIVTCSLGEKVSAAHENATVPPGVVVVGSTTQDPVGG